MPSRFPLRDERRAPSGWSSIGASIARRRPRDGGFRAKQAARYSVTGRGRRQPTNFDEITPDHGALERSRRAATCLVDRADEHGARIARH